MKKNVFPLFAFVIVALSPILSYAAVTYEKAQHRLPPVIYSLDIPKAVENGGNYNFSWTVMGYHETYNIIINVYDSSYNKIATDTVSPSHNTEGAYYWGSVQSREFHYSTNLNLNFSGSQDLIVRFFASPINDPIDNTYLSCIIPGGLGYKAADTTGRKINITGLDNVYDNNSVSVPLEYSLTVIEEDDLMAILLLQVRAPAPVNIPSSIPFNGYVNSNVQLGTPYVFMQLNNANSKISNISLQNYDDAFGNLIIGLASEFTVIGVASSALGLFELFLEALNGGNDPKYVILSGAGDSYIANYLITLEKTNYSDTSQWSINMDIVSSNGIISKSFDKIPLINELQLSNMYTINLN